MNRHARLSAFGALLWITIVGGAAARFAFVGHPTDERAFSSWREADYTQIARSFHREGMNPLYPKVDWRGDTSGHVEMELPVLPFGAALLYRVLGYHEEILRVLSAILGLGALLAFADLARRSLPREGALFATAAFAANGLAVALSGAIQPETLLHLLTILAAGALVRWREQPSPRGLLIACGLIAAAILAKTPAAHLGFLAAFCVLSRGPARALRDGWVYAGAAVALVPPLVWYAWAYHHYLDTGLSLGVSNETHLLSLALLRHPKSWVLGLVHMELRDAFSYAGIVLAALALFWGPRARVAFPAVWYAAVAVFYVVTLDTSGDSWAFYYHALSVAPACLLMGAGFSSLRERLATADAARRRMRAAAAYGLATAVLVLSLVRGVSLAHARDTQPESAERLRCARELAPLVPTDAKIVARGFTKHDWHGHPVAYNRSMDFTWMDRKGFNYAVEDLGFDELDRIAQRGGRYWFAHPEDFEGSDLGRAAASRYRELGRCGDGHVLYDLALGPEGAVSH